MMRSGADTSVWQGCEGEREVRIANAHRIVATASAIAKSLPQYDKVQNSQ